jgi:hypothetical protein
MEYILTMTLNKSEKGISSLINIYADHNAARGRFILYCQKQVLCSSEDKKVIMPQMNNNMNFRVKLPSKGRERLETCLRKRYAPPWSNPILLK